MMGGLHLGRVICNDVDCGHAALVHEPGDKLGLTDQGKLTHHVSFFVLPALEVGNVALDAQVYGGQVLDGKVFRIQTTNQAKSFAVVHVIPHLLKLPLKPGKRKICTRDQIAI